MSGDVLPVQTTDEVLTPIRAFYRGIRQAAEFAQTLRDQHPDWRCASGGRHFYVPSNLDIRIQESVDGAAITEWETARFRVMMCIDCHCPEADSVEGVLKSLDHQTEYDREVWAEYKRWKGEGTS